MPNKGYKHTEETRRKMSEIAKKKGFMFPSPLGRKLSEEQRKKLSVIHKGLNTWSKGIKVSEETKLKISNSMKGKKKAPFSEEHKRNIGLAGKGRILSLETRKKMSEARKGEKSYLWKGGITPINAKIRGSLEYRLWREAVFKRDNYTCIWCKVKSGNGKAIILNADHIKPFAYYPELRFAIDNGRTLCIDCHRKTDTFAGKGFKRLTSPYYETV